MGSDNIKLLPLFNSQIPEVTSRLNMYLMSLFIFSKHLEL